MRLEKIREINVCPFSERERSAPSFLGEHGSTLKLVSEGIPAAALIMHAIKEHETQGGHPPPPGPSLAFQGVESKDRHTIADTARRN